MVKGGLALSKLSLKQSYQVFVVVVVMLTSILSICFQFYGSSHVIHDFQH